MSDFSKVTGEGGVQTNLNFLRGENAQLKALNQQLSNELVARAQGTLGEVTDALNAFCGAADQGNPAAKAALKGFVDALDRARTASSKLWTPGNGQT